MMSLGRAKKKLRYLQSEERTQCHLKIKDVFSIRDHDHIFDDLDSDPGTPLLSPLPKSPGLDEHQRRRTPGLKPASPFRGAISPLKGSGVLEAEACIQTDHLTNKGSPLEEIAPIKTSSPIELLAAEGVGEHAERRKTCPLLFGIEDEEPVVGDLSKPQTNQRSESPKDAPQGDSESLESPPVRLKFGKPTKQNDPATSSTLPEAPGQVCKTSAPAPEEGLQTAAHLSLSPIVLIQKRQPGPLPQEQPDKQVQEVAMEVGMKPSVFHKKLRSSLQPKASCFRKPETLKQPAHAPSPHAQEEDFMILEDDHPIRFTIPKTTGIKEKPAPPTGSVEPDSKEEAFPKQAKEAEKQKDENKKKKKQGKANATATKGATVQLAPEESKDEVIEDVGGGEQICLSPDTSQDADIPVIRKRRPKGKASKPEQHGGAKIPAEKPPGKTKKSAKLPSSTNAGQEEPLSHVKKKPGTGLSSAKPKKRDEDKVALKNKKRAKEQERMVEVQNHTEPPLDRAEEPEVQNTSTANKEPASKQCAPKKPGRIKKTEKMQEILKKQVPVLEPAEVYPEASATSKRKRKPPGEWWLTQNNENNMQEQQEVVQPSQELKSNRKTPVLTDVTEREFAMTFQEIQSRPVTVQKLPTKVKKSQADKCQSEPATSQKNPKSAGGRRKPNSGAPAQRETTPVLMAEEEVNNNEASGEISPLTCSRLPRQRCVTPGDKRVFDGIYTQKGQRGSAQKCPPPFLDAQESVPVKRQRKPLQTWWEVPQSRGSIENTWSPRNPSSQASQPQMGPPQSAFHKMTSLQKTVGRGQKKQKIDMIKTPKSVRKSLATFDAIYNSGKPGPSTERGHRMRQKGRRNLLHSLEDQSEHSSENIHSDHQQKASSRATFDVCESDGVSESSVALRKSNPRASRRSNRASDYDLAFKSGPSSLIELERYEEHEDEDLPSSRIIPQTQFTPRVLSSCDLCGPPLRPVVLDNEDWDNLCVWFGHIWPTASKDGKGINPDDFHWHCHAGRAMGHMVDLQNNTFSSGKILLGSYMKKPAQLDLNAVTVFNVASSCVRVEIDGVKQVYNSGHTFMTPCGQSYSIHNMCQEPAVLWYHRMLPN